MSSGKGGSQNVTSETKLPPWLQDAAQSNIAFAKDVSSGLTPQNVAGVAGLNGVQNAAIGQAGANVGSANPTYDNAIQTTQGVQNYHPTDISAGNFLSGVNGHGVSDYMNPYIKNVIDTSMPLIDQQRQMALNGIGDKASASGAFGGSRHGVAEGVTNAQSALGAGQLGAQLYGQGFDKASGLLEGDLARDTAVQQANQQAGLQGAALNLQGAQGAGQLAGQQSMVNSQQIQQALQAGGIQQGQDQAQLQNAADVANAQRQNAIDQLNVRLGATSSTPYGGTTTQKSTDSGSLMQTLGGGLSLLGSLGSMFMFSDKKAKTNIQKLGKDPKTGLHLYAYDYKADVARAKKTGSPMPGKRVGPMAQDVAKKFPGSTMDVGGNKVITMNLGFGGGGTSRSYGLGTKQPRFGSKPRGIQNIKSKGGLLG